MTADLDLGLNVPPSPPDSRTGSNRGNSTRGRSARRSRPFRASSGTAAPHFHPFSVSDPNGVVCRRGGSRTGSCPLNRANYLFETNQTDSENSDDANNLRATVNHIVGRLIDNNDNNNVPRPSSNSTIFLSTPSEPHEIRPVTSEEREVEVALSESVMQNRFYPRIYREDGMVWMFSSPLGQHQFVQKRRNLLNPAKTDVLTQTLSPEGPTTGHFAVPSANVNPVPRKRARDETSSSGFSLSPFWYGYSSGSSTSSGSSSEFSTSSRSLSESASMGSTVDYNVRDDLSID